MALKTVNINDKDYSPALPGHYPFTVTNATQGYFSGNSKAEPCDQYDVEIVIDCGDQGTRNLSVHLRDNSAQDWRIGQFLAACGACEPEPNGNLTFDSAWCTQMVGRTGVVRLWNRSYEKDGVTQWANDVKFLNPKKLDGIVLGPEAGATLPTEKSAPAPIAPAPAQAPQATPMPQADDDIPF